MTSGVRNLLTIAAISLLCLALTGSAILFLKHRTDAAFVHLVATQAKGLFGEFRAKHGRYPADDNEMVSAGGNRERKWKLEADQIEMTAILVYHADHPFIRIRWGDNSSNVVEYRLWDD